MCVYTSERIEPANTPLQDRHAQICQVTVFLHFPKFCLEFGQHLWIFCAYMGHFCKFVSVSACVWRVGRGRQIGSPGSGPSSLTLPARSHDTSQTLSQPHRGRAGSNKPEQTWTIHTHTHTQILAFTYLFIWLLQKKCLTYSLCSKPVVCS